MKKSFESFTKKMTKKFLERKDRERNRRDRQKELLKKSDLIPICFWKSKFNWSRGIRQESNFTWKQARSIERNRVGIEFHMKICSTNWKESDKNQRNPRLWNKKPVFLIHISIGQKIDLIGRILKEQKFWKILETFFCRIIWKIVFMIWHVCSWLQIFFKIKLFKEKLKLYIKFPQYFLSSLPKMR